MRFFPAFGAAALLLLEGVGAKEAPKAEKDSRLQRVAVLEMVDLADNRIRPEIGKAIREELGKIRGWEAIPLDTLDKHLREYSASITTACNSPQCAFDAGNFAQADWVLYGSYTPLGLMDAYSLKLLDIRNARTLWTKVGEISVSGGAVTGPALSKTFANTLRQMAEDTEKKGPPPDQKRTLAVVDLSDMSALSRVLFERVCTRIYGAEYHDLMSPSEFSELLTALEINKYSVVPSLENMIGLGQKVGVSTLMYARMYRDGKNFLYRLAMYDVEKKSMVLELPPQPSTDYLKLLDYERVFFNTLFGKELQKAEAPAPAQVSESGKSRKALWISLGLLGLGGGLAAVWLEGLGDKGNPGVEPTIDWPIPPPNETDQ